MAMTEEYGMYRKDGSPRYVGTNFSWERTDAEMTKAMRKELKKNSIKASVRKHTYSGGMTIIVNVYLEDDDIIPEEDFRKNYEVRPGYTWVALSEPVTVTLNGKQETFKDFMHEEVYFSLDGNDQKKVRDSASKADYKEFLESGESWRSGEDKSIFLTEKGIKKMNLAYDIIQSFNYDDSDIMTDYFDNYFWTEMKAVKKF